jgi:hypothetical protein
VRTRLGPIPVGPRCCLTLHAYAFEGNTIGCSLRTITLEHLDGRGATNSPYSLLPMKKLLWAVALAVVLPGHAGTRLAAGERLGVMAPTTAAASLDGDRAPRLFVVEFPSLPGGSCTIQGRCVTTPAGGRR